ncbi:MAG: hypothetical protein ACRDY1_04230, partial [Acidimicrobiales bacterium]
MAMASVPRRQAAPERTSAGAQPRLEVVGPPRRRRSSRPLPTLVIAVSLVLGSLLFVAGAQA